VRALVSAGTRGGNRASFPSPLAGEGGEIDRREIEPDQGFESKKNPSPAFASLGTLSHKGRG
jgi:hypothetical protein